MWEAQSEIWGHANKEWMSAWFGQAKVSLFLLCSLQTRRGWTTLSSLLYALLMVTDTVFPRRKAVVTTWTC